MKRKLAELLASTLSAWRNCAASGNVEWQEKHNQRLRELSRAHLPHGSGFDAGTHLDRDRSSDSKLVFQTQFHHMNEDGYYSGWTKHTVTVIPTFWAVAIKISGPDRDNIKEHIRQAFGDALEQEIEG